MDSIIEGATSALVAKSLDLSLLRHQVIANNIANANTQGYRPMKVAFEDALRAVKEGYVSHGNINLLKADLDRLGREVGPEVETDTARVLLDREITKLAKNTVNYQALLTASGQLGDIMSSAIKGGKN